MNIKQKIAIWLGYGYKKPSAIAGNPLCIVTSDTLAELRNNPAFIETYQYPRELQVLFGEMGSINNKRIILDTSLSLTI